MKIFNKKRVSLFDILLNVFFVLMCVCFIIPLMLVISASFTSEGRLASAGGYGLFPKEFTLDAYTSAFSNVERIIRAYIVTFAQSVLGTVIGCVVAGMIAYPLSRTNFRFKKFFTPLVFFTMLFSAGMIPSYIVFSKYYGISDSFWIYILPGMTGGAWNTMVFRTFYKGLPESLFEAAHIDGARELTIFFRIVEPLSKPVIATIGFMTLVGKWNDYSTSMIYIRNENLYTLQFLLQRMMNEVAFMKTLAQEVDPNLLLDLDLPSENLKFAMCVLAAGPMLLVFPWFQKYFSQGLTIGAVKG